jgi:hypothetical protein
MAKGGNKTYGDIIGLNLLGKWKHSEDYGK